MNVVTYCLWILYLFEYKRKCLVWHWWCKSYLVHQMCDNIYDRKQKAPNLWQNVLRKQNATISNKICDRKQNHISIDRNIAIDVALDCFSLAGGRLLALFRLHSLIKSMIKYFNKVTSLVQEEIYLFKILINFSEILHFSYLTHHICITSSAHTHDHYRDTLGNINSTQSPGRLRLQTANGWWLWITLEIPEGDKQWK